jgi:hypothetical protein
MTFFLNGLAGKKPLNTHGAAVYQAVAMGEEPPATEFSARNRSRHPKKF